MAAIVELLLGFPVEVFREFQQWWLGRARLRVAVGVLREGRQTASRRCGSRSAILARTAPRSRRVKDQPNGSAIRR